jgi:dCTP deaminase
MATALAAAAAPRLLTISSELHLGGHRAANAALFFSFLLMTLLSDKEISILAENDIIFPFTGEKRRELDNGTKALSYGLSHAGYDLRLSPKGFMVIDNSQEAKALDVKRFDESMMYEATPIEELGSTFFVLPPFSYALGVSLERITMPNNVMGICDGKSTYARQGTIINVTPIEPGWSGFLTICIVNPLAFPARIYANEGIVQIMFMQLSGDVGQAYGKGKYQNQGAKVSFAAV